MREAESRKSPIGPVRSTTRLAQEARGEADRFTRILGEALKQPGATRQRLYLETLAEILPRLGRKMVVAQGQDLDLSVFTDQDAPATAPPARPPKNPRRAVRSMP